MEISFHKHTLNFRFEAGTSRGVLTQKDTYFITLTDQNGVSGTGEAAPLSGLSLDATPDFEVRLEAFCHRFRNDFPSSQNQQNEWLALHAVQLPSVRFAIETALLDLQHGGRKQIFVNDFSEGKKGIPINGLVWMGKPEFMQQQIEEKLASGYNCLKMKIGAINFEQELALLRSIRNRFTASEIVLRVDANGAFSPAEALQKLDALARFDLHSIEQPIKAGQTEAMAQLCAQTPLPIALDEELIGIDDPDRKATLLDVIQPQYIILKPTLTGGLHSSEEWIRLAEQRQIGWWMTSALEANIGLNAISQFTAQYQPSIPQGLGTGQLYHNNMESPLEIKKGAIFYNTEKKWGALE